MTFTVRYPLLVGDIGGTNARFGLIGRPGGALTLLPRTRTSEHPGLAATIRAALDGGGSLPRPSAALLAIAAQVEGPVAHLTNAGWTVDASEIGTAFGLEAVCLINDFAPIAAALAVLRREEGQLLLLGPDCPAGPGARLVLGPGTGLGAAALLPVADRWIIHPTEAGHTDFGPAHEDEAALWPFLERVGGRVTAEAVLSGPGLLRLYRALARARNLSATCATPEEVSAAGLDGGEALAQEALHLFGRLLGRFAGDFALTFGAGAVYIAGGIGPKIAAVLSAGDFKAAFERKAPFEDWMRTVPTFLIADPDPALTGLRAMLAEPGRFIFRSAGWER
jgi:glucokinase